MRITDPSETPGIRILGAFCAKDEFVALQWDFRESMQNFDADVVMVRDYWRDYFGNLAPHSGNGLDDYLSNYDAK